MRENKISRRDFLKTAAVGAVGVGALLSGCGTTSGTPATVSPSAGSVAKYVPGTYTSSQIGYNGVGNDPTVVVTVTFSETEITDVQIVGDGQSPELGGIAIERAPDQILAVQSVEIDGYASATKTTTAIKKGVADCISQASLSGVTAEELLGTGTEAPVVDADTAAWGEKPVPITEISATYTYDAVIVGCGTAGIPCALSAAENGLKAVILQKGAENTGIRSFVGARDTQYQKALGVEIDRSAIIMDLMRYSSYYASQRHLALWADYSGEAINWMGDMAEAEGAQVSVQTDLNYTGMHFQEWPTYHAFNTAEGEDFDLAGCMLNHFASLGGEVMYETPMVQLVQGENGAVTGVIAQCADGSYIQVNGTKGVVIATGGYANNQSMLRALNPSDCDSAVQVNCIAGTDGDGLRAMYWAGADIDTVHTAMSFERAATLPGMEGGQFDNSNMFWMGSQPFLQVNKLGERVGNESCPYDYDLHLYSQQPGKVWISIFDQNWKEQFSTIFHTVGCAGHMDPDFLETYNGILLEQGFLQTADTIEELAGKLYLPADTLAATVARYNELCEKGSDDDFYKESFRMGALNSPPYYGITCGGSILCTMDGAHIDTGFHVLDKAGQPIEGLYAVGNDSGMMFYNTYPELAVGIAAGRSITWGYLCGKEIAKA